MPANVVNLPTIPASSLRPGLSQRQLFQIFGASLVRTTAWFPVLAIGIAVLFTLASFGTDALGVPHRYLNSFVFCKDFSFRFEF